MGNVNKFPKQHDNYSKRKMISSSQFPQEKRLRDCSVQVSLLKRFLFLFFFLVAVAR